MESWWLCRQTLEMASEPSEIVTGRPLLLSGACMERLKSRSEKGANFCTFKCRKTAVPGRLGRYFSTLILSGLFTVDAGPNLQLWELRNQSRVLPMSFLTVEVEIDHGRISPRGAETLPEKAVGLFTILSPEIMGSWWQTPFRLPPT